VITRRIRAQLAIFATITLLGVAFVGARYAQLDRLVIDQTYTVVAHYPQSGGIFVGGEVTYRGVRIGKVTKLELTGDGVDVHLEIEDKWDKIPTDTRAVVGNRSALGEQYVDLQPNVDHDEGPYLRNGSQIDDVATPIPTELLLGDIATTVSSVDRRALRTTVHELGTAFGGAGEDLQRIIDSGNSFVETANQNFDVTTALIHDTNTVLQGQVDSATSLRTFADGLSAFSRSLARADQDLRHVIDSGSFTANQLRTLLQQNEAEIAELLDNAITTGRIVVANLPGIRQMLVLYPVLLEGAFGVIAEEPTTGLYAAHSGLILVPSTPCRRGYETNTRGPQNLEDRDMNLEARCTEPPTRSNPRGYQNLPRLGPELDRPPGADDGITGWFDPASGDIDWTDATELAGPDRDVAFPSLGGDSWKWLYLEPLLSAGR
jgi:phospholipid/cholesterol/gamma-HCH transport system substrate-binding protein